MRFIGIDPATQTGIVVLDIDGNVLFEADVKGKGPTIKGGISIDQLVSLENQIYQVIQLGDEIAIEEPASGTQKAISTGMIHGGLRSMIFRKKLSHNDVNPMRTKKYVGETGWTGDVGNKRRWKGKTEKKEAMAAAVLKHFGYTHKSDNVVDAYIIARISLNLYRMREYMPLLDTETYQTEVINDILNKA